VESRCGGDGAPSIMAAQRASMLSNRGSASYEREGVERHQQSDLRRISLGYGNAHKAITKTAPF
jgi:hypothetical protein